MTNEEINEIKLKELEERIKQLEDKVFNQWLSQYEPKTNWLNYWSTVYDVEYGPVSKYPPLAYEEPPKGWHSDYSTLGPVEFKK